MNLENVAFVRDTLIFCALENLNPRFDDGEFRSQHVQRAFQYLKLWETAKENLDHFWFVPNHTMGDCAECLEILVR